MFQKQFILFDTEKGEAVSIESILDELYQKVSDDPQSVRGITSPKEYIEHKAMLGKIRKLDADVVLFSMDTQLRDEVDMATAPCYISDFFNEYRKRHKEVYGVDFLSNSMCQPA